MKARTTSSSTWKQWKWKTRRRIPRLLPRGHREWVLCWLYSMAAAAAAAAIVYLGFLEGCAHLAGSSSTARFRLLWDNKELCLGLVAVIWASIHSLHLSDVAANISTRPTGSFPEHLLGIEEIIRSSRSSLDVVTDAIDYGSFFDPVGYDRVFNALLDAIANRRVAVRFLTPLDSQPVTSSSPYYSKTLAQSLQVEGFAKYYNAYIYTLALDDRFKTWVRGLDPSGNDARTVDRSVRKRVAQLIPTPEGQAPPALLTFDDCRKGCLAMLETPVHSSAPSGSAAEQIWAALLLLRLTWYDGQLLRVGANERYFSAEPAGSIRAPFYWLSDKSRDGLFLFAKPPDERRGATGFLTRDSALLSTFDRMFEEAWDKAYRAPAAP